MNLQRSMVLVTAVATLATALARPAASAPPQAPWIGRDIGVPGAAGSADVDAAGVWTIQGSSTHLGAQADHLYYASQPVRGDGSITARFLSLRGGGNVEWAHVGLMIRQDERPGSPAFSYHMTRQALPAHSLEYSLAATSRLAPESDSRLLGPVGPVANKQPNLFLRLQRVGSEIAGFYSRDGSLWFQANFAPQSLASLPEQALFGLAVTSQRQGALAIGQLDQVSVQPGSVSVYGIQACGGDKAVLLQWRPLKHAVGYNVYRGPAGAARDALVKLNAERVAGASFTDNSEGLANGTPATYAVAAIVPGADGNPAEGPLVALTATPVAAPAGLMGCSINEGLMSGGAAFDPATGEITLRGTGLFVFDTFDQLYFLSQPVEGDAQNTVQARTRPTLSHDWARAGLMIRESLDPGARHLTLWISRARGLFTQWRAATDQLTEGPERFPLGATSLRAPITLRLTRRGNTVTPEYSIDDSTTFQPAGRPITFDPPLASMLHIGLAITAAHRSAINQARFSIPEVKKL
jgi:hypothetical protein